MRRRDPLSGARVVVVDGRQERPSSAPGEPCPFCPGGLEAPGTYAVRSFPNRWPALPDGRAEVVLYTPGHDATLWSLGAEGARGVVRLWVDRTAALGSRDDVAYVLVFENRGPEAGATITHPHGQIYAFGEVPEAALRELATRRCAVCADEPGERLVAEREGWRAAVPFAARWPYELLLSPLEHRPLLDEDLAPLLVDVLERLDRLFAAPMPYMLWAHQRPVDGRHWPQAHVHVHVAPLLRKPRILRHVGAGELGSGVWFNPLPPERAAAELRAVPRG